MQLFCKMICSVSLTSFMLEPARSTLTSGLGLDMSGLARRGSSIDFHLTLAHMFIIVINLIFIFSL